MNWTSGMEDMSAMGMTNKAQTGSVASESARSFTNLPHLNVPLRINLCNFTYNDAPSHATTCLPDNCERNDNKASVSGLAAA